CFMHQDPTLPKALIFDLDETLAATGHLWERTMRELTGFLGCDWTEEMAALCKGRNAVDVASVIHAETQTEVPIDVCRKRMRESLIHAFSQEPIHPMPGAVE